MTDIRITGAGGSGLTSETKTGRAESGGGFDSMLKEAVGKVTEAQAEAEKAIRDLGAGGDVTEAMIAMEKADISFQMMVEVRNKLLTAYDEIMRMQV